MTVGSASAAPLAPATTVATVPMSVIVPFVSVPSGSPTVTAAPIATIDWRSASSSTATSRSVDVAVSTFASWRTVDPRSPRISVTRMAAGWKTTSPRSRTPSSAVPMAACSASTASVVSSSQWLSARTFSNP